MSEQLTLLAMLALGPVEAQWSGTAHTMKTVAQLEAEGFQRTEAIDYRYGSVLMVRPAP